MFSQFASRLASRVASRAMQTRALHSRSVLRGESQVFTGGRDGYPLGTISNITWGVVFGGIGTIKFAIWWQQRKNA